MASAWVAARARSSSSRAEVSIVRARWGRSASSKAMVWSPDRPCQGEPITLKITLSPVGA